MADASKENSLGLEFNNLLIKDDPTHPPESGSTPPTGPETTAQDAQSPVTDEPESPTATKDGKESNKEKKKPYVNPDRFKTGGTQRDKLSEEELAERMERMRQQNEKIKQRRLDVQADEDAFRKTQQEERVKQQYNRKVQDGVDRAREQNAKRKMDKVQSREWDSGKSSSADWKGKKAEGAENEESPQRESGGWSRGGRGGRGRGGTAGRGTGRKREAGADAAKPAESATPTTTPAPQASAVSAGTETKE